jgi:hypothetical protein
LSVCFQTLNEPSCLEKGSAGDPVLRVMGNAFCADNSYMVKTRQPILLCLAFFLFVPEIFFSQGVPRPLGGVWENDQRIVSFFSEARQEESALGQSRAITGIVLKQFYGWYYDRAAEPQEIAGAVSSSSLPPRDKNNTSAHSGEILITTFEETSPVTDESGSWTMRVLYPPYRESDAIALAVIRNNLYLNFYIRYDENPGSLGSVEGFWRAAGTASGITVSKPWYAQSVESLYITADSAFRIRYWEADLEPDLSERAYFSDGAVEYAVDKYLVIGGKTFTCVQGRGTRIRQITKSPAARGYELSGDGTLCAFAPPYLWRSQIDDIYAEIAKANARKIPSPPPPFPPKYPDFHYDVIKELRKYTPNWKN